MATPNITRQTMFEPENDAHHLPQERLPKNKKNYIPNPTTKQHLFTQFDIPEELQSLPDKQIVFAKLYVEKSNRTMAAIGAGYSQRNAHVVGSKLLKKESVRLCVDFFKSVLAQRVPKLNKDNILAALWEVQKEARINKQYNPAVRALELIGTEYGMFVQRTDITVRKLETVTDLDLERLEAECKARLIEAQAITIKDDKEPDKARALPSAEEIASATTVDNDSNGGSV